MNRKASRPRGCPCNARERYRPASPAPSRLLSEIERPPDSCADVRPLRRCLRFRRHAAQLRDLRAVALDAAELDGVINLAPRLFGRGHIHGLEPEQTQR